MPIQYNPPPSMDAESAKEQLNAELNVNAPVAAQYLVNAPVAARILFEASHNARDAAQVKFEILKIAAPYLKIHLELPAEDNTIGHLLQPQEDA